MNYILFVFISSLVFANSANIYTEFLALCPYSHQNLDDPIIYPNQPNASHLHDYLGSNITNAYTTNYTQFLAGGTNCQPIEDLSAYWHPTLLNSLNASVHATSVRIYYSTINVNHLNVQPMPNGLKMLTGNATADYKQKKSIVQWSCVGESKNSEYILPCSGNNLEVIINFPECWDGVNLDSYDHRSHMYYANAQGCPQSHPVILPRLQYKIQFGVNGVNYRLVTDYVQLITTGKNIPGNTLHADALIAWSGTSMLNRVINCNRAGIKCGVNI